jgi:hypothetical protein
MTLRVCIFAALAFFTAVSAHGQQLTDGPDSHAQNARRSWSLRRVDESRRFEVRNGDRWADDGNAPKERSEIYFPDRMTSGRGYRIMFRFMLEQGPPNRAAWMSLAQVQSIFRRGDPGHSPPLALELKGDRLRVVTRTSRQPLPGQNDAKTSILFTDLADLVRGRWYVMMFDLKLDPFGNGRLVARRDGQTIVNYRGPLGFVEPIGAYLKQGIYRATTAEWQAVRFSEPVISPLPLN